MKNVKYRIIFVGLLLLTISGCSVQSRFDRLVTRNPWLLENQKIDTVIVKNGNTTDTFFNITKNTDSFFFENTKIIKRDSKIFVYSKVPPCTTNISKTIIQPSKEYVRWKEKKESSSMKDYFLYALSGIFVMWVILRK
jgi:hypothetical protein